MRVALAHAAARPNNSSRSRVFCASDAARSNSVRASPERSSFRSKSARTAGNR